MTANGPVNFIDDPALKALLKKDAHTCRILLSVHDERTLLERLTSVTVSAKRRRDVSGSLNSPWSRLNNHLYVLLHEVQTLYDADNDTRWTKLLGGPSANNIFSFTVASTQDKEPFPLLGKETEPSDTESPDTKPPDTESPDTEPGTVVEETVTVVKRYTVLSSTEALEDSSVETTRTVRITPSVGEQKKYLLHTLSTLLLYAGVYSQHDTEKLKEDNTTLETFCKDVVVCVRKRAENGTLTKYRYEHEELLFLRWVLHQHSPSKFSRETPQPPVEHFFCEAESTGPPKLRELIFEVLGISKKSDDKKTRTCLAQQLLPAMDARMFTAPCVSSASDDESDELCGQPVDESP